MKTVLITGGTKGIGAEIANKYINKGYRVIINYANSDISAKEFIENNNKFKDNIFIIKADLSTINGMNDLVRNIEKLDVNIDLLVLNVGITKREPFEEITYESWIKVMDTNLNIPFFLVQKLSDMLVDNASIIFISSVLGIKADGVSIQYGVSKGAIIPLVKYLAKYYASRRITVNCISPGFINTDWQINKHEEQRMRIESKILLNRFGNANEISEACFMIENNRYITGKNIIIDGGYTI